MKAKDLVFKKLEDKKTPKFNCNVCNKPGGYGFYMADVEIAADATFSVIVCSPHCEKMLKDNKYVDVWLREEISRMRKIHRMQAIKKMGKMH